MPRRRRLRHDLRPDTIVGEQGTSDFGVFRTTHFGLDSPYPNNYEEIVRASFQYALFDPFSAQYQLKSPVKGWKSNRDGISYGWLVEGLVNAKNRMGGYVGYKPFSVLIRNGEVTWRSMQ
jgi:hypothetical protein